MPGEFQYEPADANDTVAESFLTSFVQSGSVLPLTVQGDGASSPFSSLNPALEGVKLQTSVTGEYSKRRSVHVSNVPSRIKCAAYYYSFIRHHFPDHPDHERGPTELRRENSFISRCMRITD